MKILVCGGRDFNKRKMLFSALDELHAKTPITIVVHGGQRGADILAGEWAVAHSVEERAYPVNHEIDGPWPGAGPRRNLRMFRAERHGRGLDLGLELVVAFPGGRGTEGMCAIAEGNGITVLRVVKKEDT